MRVSFLALVLHGFPSHHKFSEGQRAQVQVEAQGSGLLALGFFFVSLEIKRVKSGQIGYRLISAIYLALYVKSGQIGARVCAIDPSIFSLQAWSAWS